MSNLKDRGTLRGTLQRNSGNYNDLINKPAINGHTLIGNQSGHALGLANEDDIINVEANPLGSATADLHKILVDDTIYSIPDVVVYGTASGAIASFDDGGNDKPLKSLKVAINPVQDLHGYDSPWAGGAGKNKLQVTATSQTIAGVTVTVKDDGTFVVNGTASQNVSLQLSRKSVNDTPLPEGQLIMTGCPSGGSTSSYYLTCWRTNSGNANDVGNGIKFSYLSDWDFVVSLRIISGTVCNNLTFKPMIRLASESDATFAPYSNICPISGWNEAEIHRADGATPHIIDDTYNITWSEAGEVFGGELDVTSGVIHPFKYYSSYNGETLVGRWQSSMDVYAEGATPTIGAQVVDFGAYDTNISIPIPNITTLLGNNNIWSDTGEVVECVYQRDLNIAINKALSQ